MAPKVDEDAIEQVQEFANVSREDAKTAIRVHLPPPLANA
jgi:NACalpha-BTF3-like transcription factor